jgi:signal peptidase II
MRHIRAWISGTWIVLLVAALIIALDQVSKEWVRATIQKYTYIIPFPQLGNAFLLEHVENNGAAFGILQNQNRMLIIVALVVSTAILAFAPRLPKDEWLSRVFLGMQLGGALANLLDRINHGYVTDFIRVGFPGYYYWPTFNMADSAIVVGVIGLGIMIIRDDIRRGRRAKEAEMLEGAASAEAATAEPD